MGDDAFVYVTYVKTTPERLWQALTDPESTRRYWGVAFATDWTPGAPMAWVERGTTTSDPGQRVLECDPPRRLSYTWHTFTPEWAAGAGVDEELRARIAASRVPGSASRSNRRAPPSSSPSSTTASHPAAPSAT
nr:SRPBCC domain-containing protein [Glycomyces terrestris]